MLIEKVYFDDYYKFFFENSLDAILLTKPDGSIIRANPAACEMFNMTGKEICDAGRDGLVDIEDPKLEKALAERKRKGKVRTEFIFKRKDGTRFPCDLTSNLAYSSDGIVLTTIIIRDISLWKELRNST